MSFVTLPADRPGARRDAVELSLLAGVPVRRAGADGRATSGCSSTPRTCRSAPSPSRTSSGGRAFRRAASRRCSSRPSDVRAVIEDPRVAAVTLTGSTGAGAPSRAPAGKVIKKSGARAGRQRSLRRDAERRSRRGGADRGARRGSSTTASPASRPSGSSSPSRSPTSSSGASSPDSRRSEWATRWIRPRTSARSPTRAR